MCFEESQAPQEGVMYIHASLRGHAEKGFVKLKFAPPRVPFGNRKGSEGRRERGFVKLTEHSLSA